MPKVCPGAAVNPAMGTAANMHRRRKRRASRLGMVLRRRGTWVTAGFILLVAPLVSWLMVEMLR